MTTPGINRVVELTSTLLNRVIRLTRLPQLQFLIKPGKESQFVNFMSQNLKYPKEFGLNIVVSVIHKINTSKLDFLMNSAETLIKTQDLTMYI